MLFENYNYLIEHKPEEWMKHADVLIWYPVMMVTKDAEIVIVKKLQDEADKIKVIKEILKLKEFDDYFVQKGVLHKFKNGRDLLVISSLMKNEMIWSSHERSHFSVKKMQYHIEEDF